MMDATELNRLVDGARCRITDDDFDHAEMSSEAEQALIEKMVDRGYTIGSLVGIITGNSGKEKKRNERDIFYRFLSHARTCHQEDDSRARSASH